NQAAAPLYNQQLQPVLGPRIEGITKAENVRKRDKAFFCFQHIGILTGRTDRWEPIGKAEPYEQEPSGFPLSPSEKGKVALVIDIEDKVIAHTTRSRRAGGGGGQQQLERAVVRLCFLSTHLGAGQGQANQLTNYAQWLDQQANHGNLTPHNAQPLTALN